MATEQAISPKDAAHFVNGIATRLLANIETVVVGKRTVIINAMVAFLANGHVLMEDVPGVAKTVLAKTFAKSVGCNFQRVQCTPDLLPSDVTGISIFNQKSGEFEFRPGPAFTNILLADELNRATPRTQSALLECMAEGQITLDNVTRKLPRPFMVFATQNPIEYEGTFPLPEAQLDSFCMRLRMGYPEENTELAVIRSQRMGHPVDTVKAVTSMEEVVRAQEMVKLVQVPEEIEVYIIKLVRATRSHADIAVGASPRASIALCRAAQAFAAMKGWGYVMPDFVKLLAPYILEHRLVLKPEARLHRAAVADIVWDLVEKIPMPAHKEAPVS